METGVQKWEHLSGAPSVSRNLSVDRRLLKAREQIRKNSQSRSCKHIRKLLVEVRFHSETRWDGVKRGGGGVKDEAAACRWQSSPCPAVGRFACCEMKESECILQRCFSSPRVKDELRGQRLD